MPIELLFAQINDGQAYAMAGGELYTNPQLVHIGYHNIKVTKCMEIAFREWRAKPVDNKTWANLKLDMKATHLDLGLTTTTETGGYGAHQAEEQAIDDATQTYFAIMLDQQTVTTATIARPTIMETMKLLLDQVKGLSTKKTTASNKATKPLSHAKAIKASCAKCEQQNKDKHYCWTHRCQATKEHTSATCKTPVENMKRQPATYNNCMGGSNASCF